MNIIEPVLNVSVAHQRRNSGSVVSTPSTMDSFERAAQAIRASVRLRPWTINLPTSES